MPRESLPGERRVAATPDTTQRLIKLGFAVAVERGAGDAAGYGDAGYAEAGAELVDDAFAATSEPALLVKVNPPTIEEIGRTNPGTLVISLLMPAQNEPLVAAMAARGLSAIALDKIPRISRAQKMDVLSSMANIAGYRAILEAANLLPRFFGGQITAAGKTPPARVLIIGAGVAGLAAIGAARGLGAEVYAFDTRKPVREQVESMGGRFLTVEIEESGEGKGGYAKEMSQAFIDAEMALFREQAPNVDVVVTTALIPGKKAPLLWTRDMVEAMKPGSVVVDLAAAQGGNCELTLADEVVVHAGVSVVGYTDLTSRLAGHASQFFARNVVHLLDDMTHGGEAFRVDHGDESAAR
ncbi:MAG: Re/Si-specific NAD(P)(+) transhydrogenase subunit alpha [Myxococcota bacterium]